VPNKEDISLNFITIYGFYFYYSLFFWYIRCANLAPLSIECSQTFPLKFPILYYLFVAWDIWQNRLSWRSRDVILPKKITIENVLVILFIKMTRSFDTQDHMLLVSRISFNTFKNIKNFHKKMLRVHFDILYARQVASQKPIHLVTCGKKRKIRC
jgi:hypothetical protein